MRNSRSAHPSSVASGHSSHPAFGTSLSAREATDAALGGILTSIVVTLPAALVLEIVRATFQMDRVVPDRMSIAVSLAVIVSLVLLVAHRTRPVARAGRRGAVATMATLILWLPFLAFGAAVVSGCPDWAHGSLPGSSSALPWNRDLISPMLLAPFVIAVPVLLCLAAASARHPRLDPLLRVAAFSSIVIVGVATLGGLVRARHIDADTYVASLPTARTLQIGDATPLRLTDGADVTYRRDTHSQSCTLEGVATPTLYGGFSCQPLTFRYDSISDLWTVVDEASLSQCSPNAPCAFNAKDKKLWTRISAADVRGSIAPPIAWTIGGAIGVALGIGLFGLARRRRAVDGLRRPIEATLHESGWASVAATSGVDGHKVQLSLESPVVPGPVLLELREEVGVAYREGAGHWVRSWRRGTLEGLREEQESGAVALVVLALTTCLLCGAPLVTWWMSCPQRLS